MLHKIYTQTKQLDAIVTSWQLFCLCTYVYSDQSATFSAMLSTMHLSDPHSSSYVQIYAFTTNLWIIGTSKS